LGDKWNIVLDVNCHSCQSSITEGQKFCANCGEVVAKVNTLDNANIELECDQCGADLFKNQKFCGSCGVEIDWSVNISPQNAQIPQNESQTKKYLSIAAAVVGVLMLFGLFSSSGPSQQEECMDREMAKFGAFADPKGWAIKSRLYCQSLYP
jgi:predicted RNA-binding Zn-ribbon protein involved in translation (DUF1610 family)